MNTTKEKTIELDWGIIRPYPSVDRASIKNDAREMYDKWVCDQRYFPEDVARMILLVEEERVNER